MQYTVLLAILLAAGARAESKKEIELRTLLAASERARLAAVHDKEELLHKLSADGAAAVKTAGAAKSAAENAVALARLASVERRKIVEVATAQADEATARADHSEIKADLNASIAQRAAEIATTTALQATQSNGVIQGQNVALLITTIAGFMTTVAGIGIIFLKDWIAGRKHLREMQAASVATAQHRSQVLAKLAELGPKLE